MEAAALFLLANLVAGGWRIFAGPADADRLQAVLLFGTSLVAILLLLAYAGERRSLIDVALVMAFLAAWVSVGFVVTPGFAKRERDP